MKLDFRTKFLMTIVISTVCISGILEHHFPYITYIITLLPFALLLLEKKYKMFLKGTIWVFVAIALSQLVLHQYRGFIGAIALLIVGVVLKMVPGVMMGYYAFASSTMSDIVASLKRMKVPDLLVIPISVMFRFAYSTIEDYRIVNDAMQMHGLTMLHVCKEPLRMMEYRLVPLLMVVTKTADDVAISAMTRGMRVGVFRTSISQPKLHVLDYSMILVMLAIIALFVRAIYA